jgi:hypothetical protein
MPLEQRLSSVEDFQEIPLFVHHIDKDCRIIHLTFPKVKTKIKRRARLSRFEWTLKGSFFQKNLLQINNNCGIFRKKNQILSPFTLISVDTILANDTNERSLLSTFEMQLEYKIQESNSSALTETQYSFVDVELIALKMSFSYFFTILMEEKTRLNPELKEQQRPVMISIFESNKIAHFKTQVENSGLLWQEKYWTFDIVLHWLIYSDSDKDILVIIDFLKEHERLLETQKRQKTLKKIRYYSHM